MVGLRVRTALRAYRRRIRQKWRFEYRVLSVDVPFSTAWGIDAHCSVKKQDQCIRIELSSVVVANGRIKPEESSRITRFFAERYAVH